MMMTAVSACRALRARSTSMPSMSGRRRSRRTRSGLTSSAVWSPSLPVPTPWTSIWSPASTREQSVRMFRSSSTTRMLSILPKIADISGRFAQFLTTAAAPIQRRFPGLYPYRRGRARDGSSVFAFPDSPGATDMSGARAAGRRDSAQAVASVVAADAIEGRVSAAGRVLLAATIDAPAHREGSRRGPEAQKAHEVVHQPRPGVGANDAHPLDGPVAGLAGEFEARVGLVGKYGELRDFEHSGPRDRLTASCVVVERGDLGVILSADDPVASHAAFDRWEPGVLGAARVGVTVLAGNLERPRVDHVAEENRVGT